MHAERHNNNTVLLLEAAQHLASSKIFSPQMLPTVNYRRGVSNCRFLNKGRALCFCTTDLLLPQIFCCDIFTEKEPRLKVATL